MWSPTKTVPQLSLSSARNPPQWADLSELAGVTRGRVRAARGLQPCSIARHSGMPVVVSRRYILPSWKNLIQFQGTVYAFLKAAVFCNILYWRKGVVLHVLSRLRRHLGLQSPSRRGDASNVKKSVSECIIAIDVRIMSRMFRNIAIYYPYAGYLISLRRD